VDEMNLGVFFTLKKIEWGTRTPEIAGKTRKSLEKPGNRWKNPEIAGKTRKSGFP
jgi:hypothetical protein